MMTPPPTITHERIARNLETLLNVRLTAVKPEWQADREVGVLIEGDEKYNPEPDVTVIDTSHSLGQIYAERFYFVAEVLSESDKKAVLEAKLRYYQDHEHNRCVLFVHQDSICADQYDREGGVWRPRHLKGAQEPLTFRDIGTVGRLGDLYKFTPLDPFVG
jgi:Uma2 family endonuclease